MGRKPPWGAFEAESEEQYFQWDELWSFCRAIGKTPAEAKDDPQLPFNISVMRASRAYRRFRWGLMHQHVGAKDEGGSNHIMNTLKFLYEDA